MTTTTTVAKVTATYNTVLEAAEALGRGYYTVQEANWLDRNTLLQVTKVLVINDEIYFVVTSKDKSVGYVGNVINKLTVESCTMVTDSPLKFYFYNEAAQELVAFNLTVSNNEKNRRNWCTSSCHFVGTESF